MAKTTTKRSHKAARAVPAGSPKVPQHVEKAEFISPKPRAAKTRSGRGKPTFFGFRRENGRVGIRNHVVILPLDDLSNAACEAVGVVIASNWLINVNPVQQKSYIRVIRIS